jgi:sugar phosphate isomerase/epimerase
MIDRREFLRRSAAAGVAAAWGGSACARAASAGGGAPGLSFPLDAVGLQLYTVRSLMQRDVERTLAQVAAAGYALVETAGLYDRPATALRALFERNGLRSSSGHYPLEQFESGAAFASATALGQEFVVVPWLPARLHDSPAAYGALADRLNRFGERARSAGLRLAYHNHDFEFETFGGGAPVFDTLLAKTDPALVFFELDAYWAYKAGYDPIRYLERHPGRFPLVHVKDGTASPERAMVDVGKGVIDFGRLLSVGRGAGLRYAFVEHDEPADALLSIRASHDHLARLLRAD